MLMSGHSISREEGFWRQVEQALAQAYGLEAKLPSPEPAAWSKPQILGFIDHFSEELAKLCDRPENARQCGVQPASRNVLEESLRISYSSFRRIFKLRERESIGISIKNRFAIYCGREWGCKGFEDFVHHLSEEAGMLNQHPPILNQEPGQAPESGVEAAWPPSPPAAGWVTSYKQATWVGRETELANLLQAHEQGARIMGLLGITGIGKTALAERLVQQLGSPQAEHGPDLWVIDYYDEPHKGAFLHFAQRFITDLRIPISEPKPDIETLLNGVVAYLSKRPHLILLNSVEYLLGKGPQTWDAQFSDPWWNKFFLAICKQQSFDSLLVLTSQVRIQTMGSLASRYGSRVHQLPLKGLPMAASMELFQKRGIDLEKLPEMANECLRRMATVFDGHPLALETIAGEIMEDFQGDVLSFWDSYGTEIVKAEQSRGTDQAMEPSDGAFSLHDWSITQREHLELRMEHAFEKLQEAHPAAYLLLITISHKPVLHKTNIVNHMKRMKLIDPEDIDPALDALVNRFLLRKQKLQYEQHDLIRSVSQKHLKRMGTI